MNISQTALFINNKITIKDEEVSKYCSKYNLDFLIAKESDVTINNEGGGNNIR